MSEEDPTWEWFSKSHYVSYREDEDRGLEDNKGPFRESLIRFWVDARAASDPENTKSKITPFQALEELFEAFEENPEIFMRVVEFTNRNRDTILEEINNREYLVGLDLLERDVVGLKAVIREWDKQRGDSTRRDSLSELILSRKELSEWPEFEVGALCTWVRRIRKGFKFDSSDVDFCYNILERANRRREAATADGNWGHAENFATIPSRHLKLLVEIQMCLTESRLARPRNAQASAAFEADIKRIFESEGQDESQPWIIIFYWWALRIKFRRAISTLSRNQADEVKREMRVLKSKMPIQCQQYIDCLGSLPPKNGKNDSKTYQELVEYHGALVDFFPVIVEEDPRKRQKMGGKLWGLRGKLRKHEGKLLSYSTTTTTRNTNLFSDLTTTKVDSTTGTSIISKCRNSIRNSRACCISIEARNSHQSATMLMLVSADLVLRIRYFLSGNRIRLWSIKKNSAKGRGQREMDIAVEIQGNLLKTLSEIRDQLSTICDNRETQLISTINYWIGEINQDLVREARGDAGGFSGPLGQIGETLDSLVRCQDEDSTKVIQFIGNEDALTIANSGDSILELNGHLAINPYTKPIGESPQLQ